MDSSVTSNPSPVCFTWSITTAESEGVTRSSGTNTFGSAYGASSAPFTCAPLLLRVSTTSSLSGQRLQGSYGYDCASEKFKLTWPSLDAFEGWLKVEQEQLGFEFLLHSTQAGRDRFLWTRRYVCARKGSGGNKHYVKKFPARDRNVPTKRTNCPCVLVIKSYHTTSTLLGYYEDQHNHATGHENMRFMRISPDIRQQIYDMVKNRMDIDHIVKQVRLSASHGALVNSAVPRREEFITRADVRRIEKVLDTQLVRLHRDDGCSVDLWVSRLLAEGSVLFFKRCSDSPPPMSGLADNLFCLIIQTSWQRDIARDLVAFSVLCIDGTHNTTQYNNTTLFTLLTRDRWGHGVPIAWMIASNGTEETIFCFLHHFRSRNPEVDVRQIMTDKDRAQINACKRVYPGARVFLCWWHVLKAWRQHFSTEAFPLLWRLLQQWLRVTDRAEFSALWEEIQRAPASEVPDSVKTYLADNWMDEIELWSARFRVDRSLLEDVDTNMLIEAWHHVLKAMFLHNKRNRRLDHLIYTLVTEVVPYYEQKHRRRLLGFEGADLPEREHKQAQHAASLIPETDISSLSDGSSQFLVRSQSRKDIMHEVDLELLVCSCEAFPHINFCKHIAAVQQHYLETPSEQEEAVLHGKLVDLTQPVDSRRETPYSSRAHPGGESTILLQKIAVQVQELSVSSPPDPAMLDVLRTVHGLLSSVGTSALPATQTVLPAPSLVPSHSSYSGDFRISMPAVKRKQKPRLEYGERSGKRAKKDALSTA